MLRSTLCRASGMFRQTPCNLLKAIVAVKRCPDYNIKVRLKDGQPQLDTVKTAIGPFDEIAMQEAVNQKAAGAVTEIIAVTVGTAKNDQVMLTALAMGADKGIHVTTSDAQAAHLEPLAVAKIFQKIHEQQKADLYFFGKAAIDDDAQMTGQLFAGLIGSTITTNAAKVEINKADKKLVVEKEVDSGSQVITTTLPAVITVDLRINTPKSPSLPAIMKAKKKPVQAIPVDTLGVNIAPRLQYVSYAEPAERKPGQKVADVAALVNKLKNEAKVI